MTSERTKVRRPNWCASVFVAAAVGVAAHAGCTPDFDALLVGPGSGGSGTGGREPGSGGANSSGGTVAGAGESGNPSGGQGGDHGAQGGASADAGQGGGGAGGSEAAEGGAGGDVGASGGASGSAGASTLPSTGGVGGGGGAVECAERFADCNAATVDDGCETFLDSQQSCGTTCAGGDACTALTVCNAGECVAAQGLVEFSIPFSATGQGQRFAQRFSPMPDLTLKTLTMRLYAPGASTSGVMTIYPTDKDFRSGPAVAVLLTTLNEGWTDVVVPMGEATTNFDPLAIYQLTFDIQGGAGPWEPVTKIYLDSIWSSDGVISESFAANYAMTVPSSMLRVEGSTYLWLDALPAEE